MEKTLIEEHQRSEKFKSVIEFLGLGMESISLNLTNLTVALS